MSSIVSISIELFLSISKNNVLELKKPLFKYFILQRYIAPLGTKNTGLFCLLEFLNCLNTKFTYLFFLLSNQKVFFGALFTETKVSLSDFLFLK